MFGDLTFVDLLLTWTPAAAILLSFWFALMLLVVTVIYQNRVAIATWLNARLQESNTKHAFTLAEASTAAWLLDLVGMLPAGEHMSFHLVEAGWAVAIALFIYPAASTKNPLPQSQEKKS